MWAMSVHQEGSVPDVYSICDKALNSQHTFTQISAPSLVLVAHYSYTILLLPESDYVMFGYNVFSNPSVCRLSVTFVHTYIEPVEIVGNVSTPFCTTAIH